MSTPIRIRAARPAEILDASEETMPRGRQVQAGERLLPGRQEEGDRLRVKCAFIAVIVPPRW
jgi:hypothetical protein